MSSDSSSVLLGYPPHRVALRIPCEQLPAAQQLVAGDGALAAPDLRSLIISPSGDGPAYVYAASASALRASSGTLKGAEVVGAVELALQDIHCCSCTSLIDTMAADAAGDSSNPIVAGTAVRSPFDRAVFIAASSDPAALRAVHDAAVTLVYDKAGKGAAIVVTPSQLVVADQGRARSVQDASQLKATREELRLLPIPAQSSAAPAGGQQAARVFRRVVVPVSASSLDAAKHFAEEQPKESRTFIVPAPASPTTASPTAVAGYLFTANKEVLSSAKKRFGRESATSTPAAAFPSIMGSPGFDGRGSSSPTSPTGARAVAIEFALQDIYCGSCVGYLNELLEDVAASPGTGVATARVTREPLDRAIVVVASHAAATEEGVTKAHDAAIAAMCDKAGKGAAVVGESLEQLTVVDGGCARTVRSVAECRAARDEVRRLPRASSSSINGAPVEYGRRALRVPASGAKQAKEWAADHAADPERAVFASSSSNGGGEGFLYAASDAAFARALTAVPHTGFVGAVELALQDIHCCSCTSLIDTMAADAAGDASNPIVAGTAVRSPFDRAVFFAASADPAALREVHDAAVTIVCDQAGKGAALVPSNSAGGANSLLVVDEGRVRTVREAAEDCTPLSDSGPSIRVVIRHSPAEDATGDGGRTHGSPHARHSP